MMKLMFYGGWATLLVLMALRDGEPETVAKTPVPAEASLQELRHEDVNDSGSLTYAMSKIVNAERAPSSTAPAVARESVEIAPYVDSQAESAKQRSALVGMSLSGNPELVRLREILAYRAGTAEAEAGSGVPAGANHLSDLRRDPERARILVQAGMAALQGPELNAERAAVLNVLLDTTREDDAAVTMSAELIARQPHPDLQSGTAEELLRSRPELRAKLEPALRERGVVLAAPR